jgi:hypothetical protein
MHSRESRQMSCVDASMNSMNSRGAWMDSFSTHKLGGWLMEMCRFSSILGAFIIGMEYQQFFLLVLKKLLCTRLLEIVQNTCLQAPDWFFECCWTGH